MRVRVSLIAAIIAGTLALTACTPVGAPQHDTPERGGGGDRGGGGHGGGGMM